MSNHPQSWHTLIGHRRDGAPIYLHRGGSEPAGEGGQQGSAAGQGQQGGQQQDAPPFTAPQSQAELDKIIGERLRREREKYADYDEVKRKAAEHDKATEAQKTEIEKATGRATEAETKAAAAERRALVAEVALEKGLTPSQAKRLDGNTRDELVADADDLLKDIGGAAGKAGGVSFDQGKQGGQIKPKAGEAGHAEAMKRFGKPATAGNTT